MRLDLVFLVGRTASSGVFWGVCDLIMILGSLSANGCGCIPVLLVFWHRVSSTVACWSWVELGLSVEMKISGRAFPFDITLGGRSLVDQCPELCSPTSEAQAWHTARAPRPCQSHSFWEVWGLLPAFSRCSVGIVPRVDVLLMYLWGGRWSPRLTPLLSWRSLETFLSNCVFRSVTCRLTGQP